MRHYAGLDVSLEETAICIVDDTGKVIRELRAASDPDALVETLTATGLSFERVGLEACSLSSWLHQGLTRAGLPALCIETRAAKAAMGAMPNALEAPKHIVGHMAHSCSRARIRQVISGAA